MSLNFDLDFSQIKYYYDFYIIYNSRKIGTFKNQLLLKCRRFNNNPSIFFSQEITLTDKFDEDIFEKFINSLVTNHLEVNEDNCCQFLEISIKYEFYELRDKIIDFIQTNRGLTKKLTEIASDIAENDLDIFDEQILNEKVNLIAANLDVCFQNKLLDNIPYEILFRIFNSPKRTLHDHHLLFDFIIRIFDKFQNIIENGHYSENNIPDNLKREIMNAQILTTNLDYLKMPIHEMEVLISHPIFNQNFQPKNVKHFYSINMPQKELFENFNKTIKSLEEKCKLQEKEIADLKTKNESLESKFSDLAIEEKTKMIRLQEQICNLESEIKNLNNILKSQSDEYPQQLSSTNKIFKDKLKRSRNFIYTRSNQILNCHYTDEDDAFDGIFNALNKKFSKKKIEEKKIYEITGSESDLFFSCPVNMIVDYKDNESTYCSRDVPESRIIFDFHDHQVYITAYMIKSPGVSMIPSPGFMKSWVLEGKNEDDRHWTILDEQNDTDAINGDNLVSPFFIGKNKEFYSQIRLKMTDKNSKGNNRLEISKIELFGDYK